MYQFRYKKTKKPTRIYIQWALIPIILGVVFLGFFTNYIDPLAAFAKELPQTVHEKIRTFQNKHTNTEEKRDVDYFAGLSIQDILRGQDKYTIAKDVELPDVDAFAYVVGDAMTGEIIFEKNAHEVLPIASVTKLMTASVSLDELPATAQTVVSQAALATEGSRGMLRLKEQLQISDLLYPLLLVSSNDASEVLAETLGRKTFIQAMNRQAFNLGMQHTNFDDPSGLSEKNTSTARDLFVLASHLYNKHSIVFEISKLKEYSQGGRTWANANRFAGTQNYEGGKTGYTSKAKRTGVALFTIPFEGYGDRVIAISILRTDNRVEDYNKLLSFIENHVEYSVTPPEKPSLKNNSVTLSFVGDIMFDRGVKNSVENNFGNDYSKLFEKIPHLAQADIAFANLEGPISNQGKNVGSKYSFRFDPSVATAIKQAGIDIVSFANNHVGDWGHTAFNDTLSHLTTSSILYTGAGKNSQEASTVSIIESKGVKVGFLAFSDVGPEWMQASETQSGILLASDPKRLEYIKNARAKVDMLVVSYHWGDEYLPHNTRQETLAKSSIDAGAHIIIGHHPHVIQDIEEYNGGLIAYSLGNAIFDQHFSKETMEGMLLEIQVTKDGIKSYTDQMFSISQQFQPQAPELKHIQNTGEVLKTFDAHDSIEISWVGDIIPGNPTKDPLQNPEDLFIHVKDWVRKADIAIGNLEGVITSETESKCDQKKSKHCFAFKSDPSFAEHLRSAGFDALVVANNHSFDFGEIGFQETLTYLQAKNIEAVGAQNTISYHTEKDIRVGMVAFTHDARLNSIINTKTIESLVKEASKHSDIVVVAFHGGAEGANHQHTKNQTEIFLGENRGNLIQASQTAIDSGADVIFGSGPHVVRGIEFYKEKPIVYSAGNFAGYNTLFLNEITQIGLGATLTISKEGDFLDGNVQFFDLGTNGIPKPTDDTSLAFRTNQISRKDFDARAGLVTDDFTIIHNPNQTQWNGKLVQSSCPQGTDSTENNSLFLAAVSKSKVLHASFIPQRLVELPSELQYSARTVCLEEQTAHAFHEMYTEAQNENISLVATSGFRDFRLQENLYREWRQSNKQSNLLAVAPAGHSEHQLGTTIDVSSQEIEFESATDRFTQTQSYQWLRDNAHTFGFVQSFIPGSESITGYIPESWHWRYVGIEHAQAIRTLGVSTLEYFAK